MENSVSAVAGLLIMLCYDSCPGKDPFFARTAGTVSHLQLPPQLSLTKPPILLNKILPASVLYSSYILLSGRGRLHIQDFGLCIQAPYSSRSLGGPCIYVYKSSCMMCKGTVPLSSSGIISWLRDIFVLRAFMFSWYFVSAVSENFSLDFQVFRERSVKICAEILSRRQFYFYNYLRKSTKN